MIMNQVSQRFGASFRKARKAQGLTQIELARACGVALGTVKLIERGEGMSAAADRIADHLGQALVARAAPRVLRHEALRTLRVRRGLSQRDLASLAGVARNSLIRLERGLDVRLPVLGAVGRALGAGLTLMPQASLGQFFATTAQGSAYHGWHTPAALFDRVEAVAGPFDLDPCAPSAGGSPVRARMRFTEEDDGLSLDWFGRVFVNPPYGRALSLWVSKARREAELGAMVVGLVPARTDTAWWQDHVASCASIVFLRGRLAFGGQTVAAPFPSALVFWGADPGLMVKVRDAFAESVSVLLPPMEAGPI